MTPSSLAAIEAAQDRLHPFDLNILTELPLFHEAMTSSAMLIGVSLYLRRLEEFLELQRALPILVLGPPENLPEAFALGCSDYLRDPWRPDELPARLKRRAGQIECVISGQRVLLVGDRLQGERGELTLEPGEARMVRALMLASGATVERGFLAALAGLSPRDLADSRALDVRISRLRRKVNSLLSNALQGTTIIRAVYGRGYRLECG